MKTLEDDNVEAWMNMKMCVDVTEHASDEYQGQHHMIVEDNNSEAGMNMKVQQHMIVEDDNDEAKINMIKMELETFDESFSHTPMHQSKHLNSCSPEDDKSIIQGQLHMTAEDDNDEARMNMQGLQHMTLEDDNDEARMNMKTCVNITA